MSLVVVSVVSLGWFFFLVKNWCSEGAMVGLSILSLQILCT